MLWNEVIRGTDLSMNTAIGTNVGTIRTIVLPSGNMQCGTEDVICGSEGVDEEYGGGREGS